MRQMLKYAIMLVLPLVAPAFAISGDGLPLSADVEQAFAGRDLDAVEGVWQFADDGAVMMITRSSASTFAIALLDSPHPDIAPGTVIGQAVLSAKPNTYDTQFDSSALGNKKVKKDRATLTVTPEGMLAIQTYTTGTRLSWWRWIPYIYRVGVIDNDTKPKGLEGARKLYPADNSSHAPCL